MDTIKKYFLEAIVIGLVILVIIQRCQGPKIIEKPIIVRDTVWIKHDSIIYSHPTLTNTIKYKDREIIKYIPDSTYPSLLKQYNTLLSLYLEKNIQVDTVNFEQFGNAYITDTVTQNLIALRIVEYHIKYPEIKEKIIYPDKKNQLYIGGSLQGYPLAPIDQLNVGVLLKNKRDQIYGLYTGINKDGHMEYGINVYWKLSFRKK